MNKLKYNLLVARHKLATCFWASVGLISQKQYMVVWQKRYGGPLARKLVNSLGEALAINPRLYWGRIYKLDNGQTVAYRRKKENRTQTDLAAPAKKGRSCYENSWGWAGHKYPLNSDYVEKWYDPNPHAMMSISGAKDDYIRIGNDWYPDNGDSIL